MPFVPPNQQRQSAVSVRVANYHKTHVMPSSALLYSSSSSSSMLLDSMEVSHRAVICVCAARNCYTISPNPYIDSIDNSWPTVLEFVKTHEYYQCFKFVDIRKNSCLHISTKQVSSRHFAFVLWNGHVVK